MNLLNVKVKHTIFGVGIITDFDGNYVTVHFPTKTCKFIYPDIFEQLIKAEDPAIQKAIMHAIDSKKQAEEEKRRSASVIALNVEDRSTKNPTSHFRKTRNLEDRFGDDYRVAHLARSPILTYKEVEEEFNIKISGFGRGINITPSTIVLISSIGMQKSKFVYHDRWTTDGDYIYSGEGKTGDQPMTAGNKAISNAATEGKDIHLFVKFSSKEYYYQGVFELVDFTYENDKDEVGNVRKEYKFRLRKVKRG